MSIGIEVWLLEQVWCSTTCEALYIGGFWRRLSMASQFSRGDFLPAGLKANQVELVGNTVRIHSRSVKATAACPRCGTASRHGHSRYRRRPADLPAHGRKVELVLLVRRFRCCALRCPARISAERFPPDVTRPHARRTSRLQGLVRHRRSPHGSCCQSARILSCEASGTRLRPQAVISAL